MDKHFKEQKARALAALTTVTDVSIATREVKLKTRDAYNLAWRIVRLERHLLTREQAETGLGEAAESFYDRYPRVYDMALRTLVMKKYFEDEYVSGLWVHRIRHEGRLKKVTCKNPIALFDKAVRQWDDIPFSREYRPKTTPPV